MTFDLLEAATRQIVHLLKRALHALGEEARWRSCIHFDAGYIEGDTDNVVGTISIAALSLCAVAS